MARCLYSERRQRCRHHRSALPFHCLQPAASSVETTTGSNFPAKDQGNRLQATSPSRCSPSKETSTAQQIPLHRQRGREGNTTQPSSVGSSIKFPWKATVVCSGWLKSQ